MSSKSLERERERIARVLPRMFAAVAAGALAVAVIELFKGPRGSPLDLVVLLSALLSGAVMGPPVARRSTDPRDLDLSRSIRYGALFVTITPVLIFVGLVTFRRASGGVLIGLSGFGAGFFITYAATLRRRAPERLAALRNKG